MSYQPKYYTEFENLQGELIRVEILAPDYADPAVEVVTVNEQGVLIDKATNGAGLWGFYGTTAKIRLINSGEINPADFVSNQYTDLRCDVYRDATLIFRGYTVVDDITHEYQGEPFSLELTFTDNLALLDNIPAPFTIDEGFTTLVSVFRRILALTGLAFDLRVFFGLREIGNTDNARQFEQVKIVPRSWMKNVSEFKTAREMMTDLLQSLRCRLFQLNGEWVIMRVADYLYAPTATWTGARYAALDGAYSADSIDAAIVDDLIPLQFGQTATHKRPVVRIEDTYKLQRLPGIWNADLKLLGALQSETFDGDIRIRKYTPPFWTAVGTGFSTSYIVVKYDTVLEVETDRYLELPYVSENSFTGASGLLLNQILVSKGDNFNFNFRQRATATSNQSTITSFILLHEDVNGVRKRLTFQQIANGFNFYSWNTTTETPTTVTTSINQGLRGSDVKTEYFNYGVGTDGRRNDDGWLINIPEDGILYIKIAGFKNNQGNAADLVANITDLQFEYFFFVNESTQIESQRHTATVDIDTLNEELKEVKSDDCVKYSASGTLYNTSNQNTRRWLRFEADSEDFPLGELNTTEQMTMQGAGRQVISGPFQGTIDLHQFAQFDALRHLPIKLQFDLRRGWVNGEFLELADAVADEYKFEYIYKTNSD